MTSRFGLRRTVKQRQPLVNAGEVPGAERVPGPLADFGTRAISFLIDYVTPVIVLNVLLSLGVATDSVALSRVFTVVGILGLFAFVLWNSCYLQGTTGHSVGRRVARRS